MIRRDLNLCFVVLLVTGCASYVTPGRRADMSAFGVSPADRANATDAPIRTALAKQPLAAFPSAIAVVRVQEPGYRSRTADGSGQGRYSVVTTRDVEKTEHFDRLASLPQVNGIAPLNRLLLPATLQSDLELRQAAANLHADMLLIYTLDTTFTVDDKAAPLTMITLGLSPNKMARVNCTASAVLLDTRNGYIYGVAEETERADQLANAWTSEQAVDDSRRRVESQAFEKLVGALEATWRGVLTRYANPAPAKASASAGEG